MDIESQTQLIEWCVSVITCIVHWCGAVTDAGRIAYHLNYHEFKFRWQPWVARVSTEDDSCTTSVFVKEVLVRAMRSVLRTRGMILLD